MDSVSFETEIINGVITLPREYAHLANLRVKVEIVPVVEDISTLLDPSLVKADVLDFSSCKIDTFKDVNPVEYQREIRDGNQ